MWIYSKYVPRIIINNFIGFNSPLFNSLKSYSKEFKENNNEKTGKTTKKTVPIPKIKLLSDDTNITVTTLEEAKRLADRRNLKLIKLEDSNSNSDKPLFKLLNKYQKSEKSIQVDSKNNYKEKQLNLSEKIGKNDLDSKIKNIIKWLGKNQEVKITISGLNESENVYKLIETSIGDLGRIVQKRQKGIEMRFQILPPKKINI